MIQDIFLPKKMGTYYTFAQRLVGINMTKAHLYATVVVARGPQIRIEKSIIEPLPIQNDTADHTERTIDALKKIIQKAGNFSQLIVAISGGSVVFKELNLPFSEYEKINKVVRFEVEPLLPFPAHDAIIDFIITEQHKDGAQVLVVATQKQTIAELLSLFEQAGVNPDTITVDLFCLYGLYTQIPSYQALEGIAVLLDIDIHFSKLMIMHQKQLRVIRILPQGIFHIAKSSGSASNLSAQQVMDHLIRFGFEKKEPQDLVQMLQNNLTEFFGKVQFALNFTLSQFNTDKITKLIITGAGAEIKGIVPFAEAKLQTSCELFDIKKITENSRYTINSKADITQTSMVSVGAAVPSPITQYFTLRQGPFEKTDRIGLFKQLITTGILTITLFGILITHLIIQTRRLSHEIMKSQQGTVEALKIRFKEIPEDMDDLDEVVEESQKELSKEEAIWLAFSSQTRASFLEYLLEITSRINAQELGFVPEQITIIDGVQGEIILKAKVRDYEALKLLEKSLNKAKLFSYVEEQKFPDFTKTGMKILIKRKS